MHWFQRSTDVSTRTLLLGVFVIWLHESYVLDGFLFARTSSLLLSLASAQSLTFLQRTIITQ